MGTTILIIGGVLALLLLVVGLIVSSRDERSLVEERLGYLEEEGIPTTTERATPMTDWLNSQAGRFTWGQGLSKSLARADLKMKVGEFVALIIVAVVGGALIGFFLGGGLRMSLDAPLSARLGALPAALIGAVAGFLGPVIYLGRVQGKRLQHFDEQLADMLSLVVNGLRAGYSTMQALEAVSRELPPPVSDEFRRVVQEMQLGVPMETALQNLLRRIPSKDLDLVITAMNVQREVGGNLAEILESIAHTVRERIKLKGDIRVLTSQGRATGWIISGLPILLTIFLYIISPDYTGKLVENRLCGWPMLGIGLGLIGSGAAIIQKIVNIQY